ncbi:unnamed protein product [Urochloa humidicola]
MEASFSFETPLSKWRHYLQDMNFWLNGYEKNSAYDILERKLSYSVVQWNLGVGPTSTFTRAISSLMGESKLKNIGPFDCVIKVDLKHPATLPQRLDIEEKLAIKVAEELGLRSQEDDEISYYSYGLEDATKSLQNRLASLVPKINQKLIGKKYLLVVENLYEPIKSVDFSIKVGLPPRSWNDSRWIISTTSHDVYDRSEPDNSSVVDHFSGDDILMLTLYSLHQVAKYILGVIGHKDEQYWHHVAVWCFHYATMLLIPHYSAAHGNGDQHISDDAPNDITSDELIRQWAAQGLITVIQDRAEEVTSTSYHVKYSDIYQVGNVILEAFGEYSLLQLPFSPATKADQATESAAHFLACHNLVAECHTIEQLCEGNHRRLEHMQWISHVGDQGWHVRREWLNHGSSGPSSLIIRHCSQHSRLFAKLDHLLAKLPCLRVLDLSYTQIQLLPPSVSCLQQLQLLYLSNTPLELLPSSICLLQKLQFLSLRGCYNLTSPFSFSNTGAIVPENNNNEKINLLYLDFSYSNINRFHGDFFHHIPNVQELLLVKCSNLEELPTSVVALCSLTRLELTGTQMKSFSGKLFEEMKKLRSLKLIENKSLLFALGLFSKVRGLIDLHIEGCESMTEVEITLERHPTLRSFTIIGAPHMRKLSLRGCKMLEHVDIKQVDALEELNLSATAIKELPDSIPNMPQLKQLLLIGVPSLRRFPWHKLQRLPGIFCLDHCSDRTTNHSNPHAAQVCISDSRLFCSFNYNTSYLVSCGQLLKSFYIRVTSCKATTRKIQDEEDMVKIIKLRQLALTAYGDVNRLYQMTEGVSMVSMDGVPPFRETERHVEISAVDRYPHGISYLLGVTKSISMSDDAHVSCLSNLVGYLDNVLEECKLRRCHRMKTIFDYYYRVGTLRHTWASHLKNLTHFSSSGRVGFHALVHLRLEYCPRLEGVMSRTSALPSLVTLDILFCYNLKAFFYDRSVTSPSDYQLPRLRRIRLQELPLLEHFHVDDPILTARAWEELYVRGCWGLRRLPRLRQQPAKAVKVSGERAWWTKLRWDGDDHRALSHRGSYEPRLPPASASTRERVVIKTYLR